MSNPKSIQTKPNKLIPEKSPYLQQHAYNPVQWYPWCDEAFEKAKKEDKPIFLSIGYSTCHWCHVMEYESFEDEEVAKLMNDIFISIKVDREERPDIDNVYMTVCQMMTGSGGWPLTIIMTPDKKPFFAGTYYPKHSRYRRIGMMDLIPKIKDLWTNKHNEVLESSNQIIQHLTQTKTSAAGSDINEDVLKSAFEMFSNRFDENNGGFGSAPKFPTPHNLLFLLRYWRQSKDNHALQMVEKTLQAMRAGGIYDQIGFGFHRYSTDSEWLIPHFEKMLYDQAMLAMVYTETYQVTKNDLYKKVAKEICAYVLRDLKSQDGGFYCAEDADSESVEGKFYVWHEDEIRRILSKEEAELFIKTFNVKKDGNYSDEATREKASTNILHLKEYPRTNFESARQKLFNEREKRIHPHKDKKILTSWNGLMIAALAKAACVFENEEYLSAAKKTFDFINSKMIQNRVLLHSFCDGEAKITAHVDDYAFLIWGLLELYEATFEVKYLKSALDFNEYLLKNFWDDKNGGFYFTSSSGEQLISRQKEIYDGAIPSGNSICILNLLRLAKITANNKLEDYARKIFRAFAENIKSAPYAYTQFLCGVDFTIGPSYEIVISGDEKSEDTKKMVSAVRKEFAPNKVLILNPEGKNFCPINGKATAYVCQNYSCKSPTTDVNALIDLISQA